MRVSKAVSLCNKIKVFFVAIQVGEVFHVVVFGQGSIHFKVLVSAQWPLECKTFRGRFLGDAFRCAIVVRLRRTSCDGSISP